MISTLTTTSSLLQIKNSPIYFAELICCCCLGFKERKANLLDIDIILPILLYEAGIEKLENANITCSIYSVYLKDNIRGIAGINNRIKQLNQKTRESIIIAANSKWITIDYLSMEINISKDIKKQIMKKRSQGNKIYKSAFNLGKILSKNETKENYRLLGVNKIWFVI